MTNEEAIKTLHELWRTTNDPWYEKVYDMAINALTAQPETHEERTETHACDCISRQAAIDALRTCYDTETVTMSNGDEYINYEDAVGEIEQLQPAQPEVLACGEGELIAQPEQKGYWRHYEGYLTCSECGTEYYDDIMAYCGDDVPKFCPNCGADMRGEQDESD